jgi:hypothetical protein
MAASVTGTFGHATGTWKPGGQIAVAMIGRPSLSRPVTPRQRPGTSAARRFPPAGAGCGGPQATPKTTRSALPRRPARPPRRHEPLAKTPWPDRPAKGRAMNTNAGTTHRLRGLPGPVAVSAAFAANAWAAVPLSRGSPPGRYLAGPGLLMVPRAAGTGEHAPAAREGRQS